MTAQLTGLSAFGCCGTRKASSGRIEPWVDALETRRLLSRLPLGVDWSEALERPDKGSALLVNETTPLASARPRGQVAARDHGPDPAATPVPETEPRGTEGQNDTQATAQFLRGFGTGPGDYAAADVRGSAESFRPVTAHEDDGSIRRANPTGAVPGTAAIFDAEARIGDGPHGSAGTGSGDYDHYALPAQAGQLITAVVNAAWLGSTLDTALAIYSSTGTLVASNDDRFDNEVYGSYPDSFIRFPVPASDTYSVVVFGSGSGFQADPFDSASGGGVGSEGFYRLDIFLDSPVLVSPVEDDGAIPLANGTGLRAGAVGTAFARATIGDGPHGSSGTGTGDFDFYRVEAAAGQTIAVDTDTAVPLVGVDTAVGIYDSAGNLLAFNDDDFETFDSLVIFDAPATGTYFVVVSVFPGLLPADPFDPSSGPGVGSEGDYSITIDLVNAPRSDFYSFDLEAGDIIGAALYQGADRLNLYAPDGTLLVGTFHDGRRQTFYPESSPLPGGFFNTNTSLSYFVNSPGRYVMEVSYGFAGYTMQLRAFRPVLEQQPVFSHQVLFLDFDGATLTPEDYPAELGSNPNATLSSLSSFLGAFGLAASDESAVIDAIVATVAENYAHDVSGVLGRGRNGDFQVTGRAGEFQIEILNSRDHADPFGLYPNVSRVIIGGTQAEFGVPVLGISASVDVGNFDTSETAVVLLDVLSEILPQLPRGPEVSLIDLIGVLTGNVVSHEAGHFLGNWHTDPFADPLDSLNLMIRPYFLGNFGPDGLFGTPDDVDMDFGLSDYSRHPNEIFDGVEDTLNSLAFGLSTGTAAGTYFDFVNGTLYVSGNIDDGRKDELKVRARGDNLEVLINGALADTRPLAGVRRVFFNGSGDRDTLDASGLDLPVTMIGRGGDDELLGGRGIDLLLGGRGNDGLRGGGGDDILIAGYTAFDTNTAALRAILDEWTSSRDFATRVANLSGSGSGPRLNGDSFLRTTGSQTVFDDADSDELTGGSGRDWFFARVSAKDEIGDLRSDEVLNRA